MLRTNKPLVRGAEWNRAGKCTLNQGGVCVGVCRRLSPKKRINKPKLRTNRPEMRGASGIGRGNAPYIGGGRVVADAGTTDEERLSQLIIIN